MSSTITTPWKIEKHLCRCCHAEGTFTNMGIPCYDHLGQQEIYADMLRECLNVYIMPVSGDLNQPTYTICTDCINQLKNANKFKKQVLLCEKKFSEMYTKNVISVGDSLAHEPIVKIEFEGVKSEFKLDFSDEEDAEVLEMAPDSDEDYFLDDPPAPDASDEESKSLSLLKDSSTKRTSTRVKNAPKKPKLEQKLNTSGRPKKAPAKKAKAKKADNSGDAEGAGPAPKSYGKYKDDYKIEGDRYICLLCEKSYLTQKSVTKHLKSVHYRSHNCSECIENFPTQTQLSVHKKSAHNIDTTFKCNACGDSFNSKAYLSYHLAWYHMLGKQYKCDHCEYETFNPNNIRKHIIVHETVRKYHCKYCKKSFRRKGNLSLHEKIHTGDKRKVCGVCKQAFVQKASLNYHMMKYHPDVSF